MAEASFEKKEGGSIHQLPRNIRKLYIQRRALRSTVDELLAKLKEILVNTPKKDNISDTRNTLARTLNQANEKMSQIQKLDGQILNLLLDDESEDVENLYDQEYKECSKYTSSWSDVTDRAALLLRSLEKQQTLSDSCRAIESEDERSDTSSAVTEPTELTADAIRNPKIRKLFIQRGSFRSNVDKLAAKLADILEQNSKGNVSRSALSNILQQAKEKEAEIKDLDKEILDFLLDSEHLQKFYQEENDHCEQYLEKISSIIREAEDNLQLLEESRRFTTSAARKKDDHSTTSTSCGGQLVHSTEPEDWIPQVMEGTKIEKLYIQRRPLRQDVKRLGQILQEILENAFHDAPTLQRKLKIFAQRVNKNKARLETLDERIEEMIVSDNSGEIRALHGKEYHECQTYMDKITDVLLQVEAILKQPQSVTKSGKQKADDDNPNEEKAVMNDNARKMAKKPCEKGETRSQSGINSLCTNPDDLIPDVITDPKLKKYYLQRRPLRQFVREMSDTVGRIIDQCQKENDTEGLKRQLRLFKQKASVKKDELENLNKEICDIILSDDQEEIFSLYEDELKVSELYVDQISTILVDVEDLLKNPSALQKQKQKDTEQMNVDEQPAMIRLAQKMLQKSVKVIDTNKEIEIYTPRQKIPIVQGAVEKYEVGILNYNASGERTIMVLGATGTGKTTFLNSMMNYLFEVDSSDPFRFKLITQEDEGPESAESVTKKVTAYVLHETILPYRLTVVDTPGYGDTDGIKADKETTGLIKKLFERTDESGINCLDAIVLVVKASDTRLTAHQKHNFNSVFQLFGKDLGENIIAVATFSDAQEPPVLQTLRAENINFKGFHKLNNSAFFAGPKSTKNEQDVQEFYWNVGREGFKAFFETLKTMHPKSLRLSVEVLRKREELENSVNKLQESVKSGMAHLEQMRQEAMILEKHEAEIEANEGFEYTVEEEKWVQEETPPGQYTTNCLGCNRTCHENCGISDDSKKVRCIAMDSEGHCTICPGKCYWDTHKNVPFIYVIEIMTVKKTHEELREKWAKAQGDKIDVEEMLQNIGQEFGKQQEEVLNTIKKINAAIKELNDIAHRPRFMTDVQYIQNLIEAEKSELKPGHEERIAHLLYQRDLAVTMERAKDPNFDPFEQYRDGKWSTFIEDFNKKYYQGRAARPKDRGQHRGDEPGTSSSGQNIVSRGANWVKGKLDWRR